LNELYIGFEGILVATYIPVSENWWLVRISTYTSVNYNSGASFP